MADLFNVVVYYAGDSYMYDLRNVDGKTAVDRAKAVTESIGVRMGLIYRVMITDSDDYCVFDWRDGKLLFPTKEQCDEFKPQAG